MLFGILTILLMSTQEIWGQTYSIDLYAQNYAGGSGTKNDPYLISNDMELAKLARDVNNGNTSQAFLGKYFKLTADIDLSGGIWMPIGKYYYSNGNGNNRLFFGKFDGNGHVIKICIYNGKEPMHGVHGDSSRHSKVQAVITLLP